MTVFAICMTALSAFLLGLWRGKEMGLKKTSDKQGRQFKEESAERILSKEYINFLNYDGTEQP